MKDLIGIIPSFWWSTLPLVIMALGFTLLTLQVFRPSLKKRYDREANIVFDDDKVSGGDRD